MLTRIEIEGYKSIEHVELDMTGLTVLIGPNASGKSNFLDSFALMTEAATGSLSEGIARRGGFDTILFKGGGEKVALGFDFEAEDKFDDKQVNYKVELRGGGSFPKVWLEQVSRKTPLPDPPLYLVHRSQAEVTFRNRLRGEGEVDETKNLESESELAIFQVKDQTAYPTPYKLLRQFEDWTCYNTPINVDRQSPIRLPQTIRPGMRLFPNGGNLASVLHSIQNQAPAVWEEINEILRNVHQDFRYMTFPAEGGDGKILLRWWEHPFEQQYGFSTNLLSDGTLRLLSLLTILKSPDPPPLICIDEPELGLHPDWIKVIAELLEEAAERTQIVVATHSPILVSNVKPEHVVVVEKEDGVTSLTRLSSYELVDWLDEFRLGDLWLAGHFGGRP